MRVDAQVDPLIEKVRAKADDIIRLLALLPFAEGAEKDRLIRSIRLLLKHVEKDVRDWAESELQSVSEEHDLLLVAVLGSGISAAVTDKLVKAATQDLNAVVGQTIRSIEGYALTLASQNTAAQAVKKALDRKSQLDLHSLAGSAKAEIISKLEGSLNKHFVRVLGRNGRIYTYALDYWVAMQAQMSRALLRRQQSIDRAMEAGMDLVQISNNPSTVGDFCDLYRGKVFSISGQHPFYPPLSSCPNGGTPFHPWCRHIMIPIALDENVAAFANIPKKFLDLGLDPEASVNDFQSLWVEGGFE